MSNPKHIVIIGGGFCGMMTAVYLLQSNKPVTITIINDGYAFAKGVAFSAHTEKYLLNVRAINMSAFDEERFHFVHWLVKHPLYNHIPENILLNIYAPRKIYGDYLEEVWQKALNNKHERVTVKIIQQKAINIIKQENYLCIQLNSNKKIGADYIVLATGNTAPRPLFIQSKSFLQSEKYFANPWNASCVQQVNQLKKILIVGNGLTMIDTVQGLLENGFKGIVYTISPNGYKLIPHKYNLMVYDKILQELPAKISLKDLFILIRKHAKALTKIGIHAHLVIDALRPFTQQLWQGFSLSEKKYFIKKLSHAWTILRHRLPVHIYEMIQNLRMHNRFIPIAGNIKDIVEEEKSATVFYFNHTTQKKETIQVERVVNCTGPESDVRRSENELLQNLAASNIIVPDELHLGIDADATTGAVINNNGERSRQIFTTGSNLKGILWENTAVPDIRKHTKKLAEYISSKLSEAAFRSKTLTAEE